MDRKKVETIISLSPSQQGMLYETIRAPESGIYIEQAVCTLTGDLDIVAFERAWNWEVKRHAILRTGYVWKEQTEPLQVTLRQVEVVLLRYDWCEYSTDEWPSRMEAYLKEDRQRGFSLSRPPLIRLALFQTRDDCYLFVWTHHHILMDGWCHNLVFKEVFSCYEAFMRGEDFYLERSRPYKDYIGWLKQQDLTDAEQFWRKTLQGFTQPTLLGREAEMRQVLVQDEVIGSAKLQLSGSMSNVLQAVARRHHLTLNTLFQGAWALLLSRYSDTNDVVFGITVSGRPAELAGIETMVGLCINTLPLRIRLSSESALWSWLMDIQLLNLEMRQYEYSSAGQIHHWSDIPAAQVFYESLLVFENYPENLANYHPAGLHISRSETFSKGAQTKYALSFLVMVGEEIDIVCVYNKSRFSASAVTQILKHWQTILTFLAADTQDQIATLRNLIPVAEIPCVEPVTRSSVSKEGEIFQALRRPIEEVVAAIWGSTLGLAHVGRHDDFFASGGHSLVATQLISRLRKELGIELSLRSLFEASTVATLSKVVEQALQQDIGSVIPPIVSIPVGQALPLSFAQQRLWFLDQLQPDNVAYNIPIAGSMYGTLDMEALEESIEAMVRRHESLRTTFRAEDGQPVQIVVPYEALHLSLIDLSNLPAPPAKTAETNLMLQVVEHPFDLMHDRLLRVVLLRLNHYEHILLVTMHHIISDGWSMEVFMRELLMLYNAFKTGRPSPLPEPSIRYADFAGWQREWLTGEVLNSQLRYWIEQLQGVSVLQLPTDYPRPAIQTFHGARQKFLLPVTLIEKLRILSQREGVTLFMTLLAAFQVLLLRYSGQEDIAVGTPTANRNHIEIEELIGFFVNMLVLRTDLAGNPSFRGLLRRVREVALGAYAHQDIPFERLVEELKPDRNLSHLPLFQVVFSMDSIATKSLQLEELTVQPLDIETRTTKCDMTFFIVENREDLFGAVEYNTDLFDSTTIERMIGHYQLLLEEFVLQPDLPIYDVTLMTEAERQWLLRDWNATQKSFPQQKCLHEMFEEQAKRMPDALALVYHDEHLTYSQLNCRANQVAHALHGLGVGVEMRVGVCLERSLLLIVGLIGILKAGAVYVPLDPSYPANRLSFMVEDARVALLITSEDLIERLPYHQAKVLSLDTAWLDICQGPETNFESNVTLENLAYIIYTSGSTGRPKGALLEHRGLHNVAEAQISAFEIQARDHILQFSSLSFDASIFEITMSLYSGATLYLADRASLLPGSALVDVLQTYAITTVTFPPSALAALPSGDFPALRTLITAGEACTTDLVHQWGKITHFFNAYGLTETTIWATVAECHDDGSKPLIGRPIMNTQIYVLDTHLQPVPIGVPGELYIGGIGLARGYFGRPDLTAERFIPHPFSDEPGRRLYKTGDLVRYRVAGKLEFLGRNDQQIKIRGFRVELSEVEFVLARHPDVRECVVVIREDMPGKQQMVAYVVGKQAGKALSRRELRRYLDKHLPDYMLPALFVTLESLPLTPNGKLNRLDLPSPGTRDLQVHDEPVAPRTPLEEQVAAAWRNVLGYEDVGLDDNFFEVGGHSLLATRLISLLHKDVGVEIPLQGLFENPTVIGIVRLVEQSLHQKLALERSPIVPVSRDENLPLSFAQQRLWFLDQVQPGNAAYNIPSAMRIRGKIDVASLERSMEEMTGRHESLRTIFQVKNGQPVQIIIPQSLFDLWIVDVGGLVPQLREELIRYLTKQEMLRPFDLSKGPLVRALLLRLNPHEHILLLMMHHIISDGWSMDVFMRELAALYNALLLGQASTLPEFGVQYVDYTLWQRQWLQDKILKGYTDYWIKQLRGAIPLELPTDRPRPAIPGYRGAYHFFTLPPQLLDGLLALRREEGVTLFMTLLTGFQILLSRYSGSNDIVVGTDSANRTCVETETMIGFFVNLLVLRTDLSGQPTFREALRRVCRIVLDAHTHQDLPFEQLVDALQIERTVYQVPLVRILFVFQNTPLPSLPLHGVEVSPMKIEGETAKFDLAVFMLEGSHGLEGVVNYSTDLFDLSSILRMLEHFEVLLQSAITQPDIAVELLDMHTDAEKEQQFQKDTTQSEKLRGKLKVAKRNKIVLQ